MISNKFMITGEFESAHSCAKYEFKKDPGGGFDHNVRYVLQSLWTSHWPCTHAIESILQRKARSPEIDTWRHNIREQKASGS